MFLQGFKSYQLRTGRCGSSPEGKEASEELENVHVLRHNSSPADTGYRRAGGYQAREEETLEHDLKPNISARQNIYIMVTVLISCLQ